MTGRNFDKLEAGKTYRLIDKEGYFSETCENIQLYLEYSENGCFTLDGVDFDGDGFILIENDSPVFTICKFEMKYFELVEEGKVESKELNSLELNYSGNWCVKLPETQAERKVFKKIFDDIGVKWNTPMTVSHPANIYVLAGIHNYLIGYDGVYGEEISIYEAIIRLQTPKESEEERLTREAKERKIKQVNELEQKVKEMQATILKIKEEM